MKTLQFIILYVAMLLAFYKEAVAQTISLSELDVSKVAITKNTGSPPTSSASKFYLLGTPASLTTALGNPLTTTTQYSEMDKNYYTEYIYDGAAFVFVDNKLTDFHISNSNFYVITNTVIHVNDPYRYCYKVGDDLNRVATSYPTSYNNKEPKRLFFQLYKIVTTWSSGRFVLTKQMLDAALLFEHNNSSITGFYY